MKKIYTKIRVYYVSDIEKMRETTKNQFVKKSKKFHKNVLKKYFFCNKLFSKFTQKFFNLFFQNILRSEAVTKI